MEVEKTSSPSSAPAQESLAPVAKHEKKFAGMITPLVVDVAAGVSSVLMGAVTAWRLVMERSHSNISTLGIIKDLKGPRDSWGEGHIKGLKAGMNREKSAELIKNASTKYQALLSERFERAGFKTFSERLNILHPFQKWEVATTSLAVTGIALGSLLLLTKDMFKEAADKEKDEKMPVPRSESFVEAEQNKAAATSKSAPVAAI